MSQAAPLRRIHAAGDLELFDPTARVNYASGGYLGNSIVEGNLILGRSSSGFPERADERRTTGGAWSNVYVGCAGAVPEPSAAGAEPRVSVVDQAPVVAAKPYIVIDDVGRYALRVPLVAKDVVGAALDAPYRDVPFESVFVADASTATARREINEALRGVDSTSSSRLGIFQLDAQSRSECAAAGRRRDGPGLCHARRAGVGRRLRHRGRRRRHAPRRRSSSRRARCRRAWTRRCCAGAETVRNGPVGPERRFRARRRAGLAEGPHLRHGPRGGEPRHPGQLVALARGPRGAGARRAAAPGRAVPPRRAGRM